MDPDLERIVSEDETAQAAVERARSAAQTQLDAERAELARRREARLQQLTGELDETVRKILVDADREVVIRGARRETDLRERTTRAEAVVESAVDAYLRIVRDGPGKVMP